IDDHTDGQPHHQTNPSDPIQAGHEAQRDDNAKDRNHRNPWSAEGALQVRPADAENPNRGANDNESEQCADTDHLAEASDWKERTEGPGPQAGNRGGFPGSAELGMNIASPFP